MDGSQSPPPPSGSSQLPADPQLPADQGLPATLPPYIGAVMFESFLYGVYSILFIICVYVILRRKKRLHWVLFASAIFMFSIASADIGYTYYLVFQKLFVAGMVFEDIRPKYWLYVTNNVVADCLLLYRCYIVWGRRKHVIAGPALLLIVGAVCGYIFEGTVPRLFRHAWVYLAVTFTLNTILTLLTAGRIWWLAHKAHMVLGEGLLQRYNATITILIESGFIYSLYVVLNFSFQKHPVGGIILDAGLIQMVGIMPTLIIVQAGLGSAVDNLESNDAAAAALSRLSADPGMTSSAASGGGSVIMMTQTNAAGNTSTRSGGGRSRVSGAPASGAVGANRPGSTYRNSIASRRSKSYQETLHSGMTCAYCGGATSTPTKETFGPIGAPGSPSSTTTSLRSIGGGGGGQGHCHCASNDTYVNLSPLPIQQKHRRKSTHSQLQAHYSTYNTSNPNLNNSNSNNNIPLPSPPPTSSLPLPPLPSPPSSSSGLLSSSSALGPTPQYHYPQRSPRFRQLEDLSMDLLQPPNPPSPPSPAAVPLPPLTPPRSRDREYAAYSRSRTNSYNRDRHYPLHQHHQHHQHHQRLGSSESFVPESPV